MSMVVIKIEQITFYEWVIKSLINDFLKMLILKI